MRAAPDRRDRRGRRTAASAAVWRLALAAWAALAGAAGCRGPAADNEPPQVPRLPHLERLEVDRFRVTWNAVEDDHTPPGAIRYDVGVVLSDACVVRTPSFWTLGTPQLDAWLPEWVDDEPFVGFSVRSVDQAADSRGYGPCTFGLRAPVRIPMDIPERAPHLLPDDSTEARPDCRPDGLGGVWCLGAGEVDHLEGADWEILPLPVFFHPVAWTPLGAYAVVLRNEQVQIHLSRANGIQAYALSSGSETFDAGGGALPGIGDQAFVPVRGLAGEMRRRHLDLSGPPMTLGLPGSCTQLRQLAAEGELALALCSGERSSLLFVGQLGARLHWQLTPLYVLGDRIESAIGAPGRGAAVITGPEAGWLVRWGPDADLRAITGLPGGARPAAAISGRIDAPVVVAAVGDHWVHLEGDDFAPLPVEAGRVRLGVARIPSASSLVGGSGGLFAISAAATTRIDAVGVPLVREHSAQGWGVRGADGRHYFVRGPRLHHVLSSRQGKDWFVHPWEGPELSAESVAVTPFGGIYVSGWRYDPALPGGRAPLVARLGDESVDITPGTGDALRAPPRLAADDRGELYAFSAPDGVSWRDPASGAWHLAAPLPGELTGMIGVSQGVLAAVQGESGPRVFHCQQTQCFEIPVPSAAQRRTLGALVRHGQGFCAGVASRGLWCREGATDDWVAVTFAPDQAARQHLGPGDPWSIADARELSDGGWLLAVKGPNGDFLAQLAGDRSPARLLASGLRWAGGDVLLEPDEEGEVVGLEPEGPVLIRYGTELGGLPDLLYQ